jgi:inner membrane protein
MHPLTHLASGWVLAVGAKAERRERALISAAAVFPDLDGLGLIPDLLTRGSASPTSYYPEFHHVLLHGIFGALVMAAIGGWLSRRRLWTAALCFAAVHLHLLEDLAGSGGPDGDHWTILYLGPFSRKLELLWAGQWPLNAWQNIAITFVLLAVTLWIAWAREVSPLEWISARANSALVKALRARFGAPAAAP